MTPLDVEDQGGMEMEEMEKTLLPLEVTVMMKILLPLVMRRMALRSLVYFVPILGPGPGRGRTQGQPLSEGPHLWELLQTHTLIIKSTLGSSIPIKTRAIVDLPSI